MKYLLVCCLALCVIVTSCSSADKDRKRDSADNSQDSRELILTLEISYRAVEIPADGSNRRRVLLTCDSTFADGFEVFDSLYCIFARETGDTLALSACTRSTPSDTSSSYWLPGAFTGFNRTSDYVTITFPFSPIKVTAADYERTEYDKQTTWFVDCHFTAKPSGELEYLGYGAIHSVDRQPVRVK